MRTTAALRRVARSVGASAVEAEDVAQSTLHAALRERARGGSPGPGWLRAAARHRAIDWLRRGERRMESATEEELARRHAPTPAPPELALQFEVQRSLMVAVEALPDPYREVIFLRYFEEVSVPEIARRRAVPIPTVRTWLTRAHAKLRERLLGVEAHRSPAWIAALSDFGRGPSGVPVPALGDAAVATTTTTVPVVPIGPLTAASLLMSFKTLIVAILALVVIGVGWRLAVANAPTNQQESMMVTSGHDVERAVTAPKVAPVAVAVDDARRDASTKWEVEESDAAQAQAPEGRVAVRGLVFDGDGKPIAGMRVRVVPALPDMGEMVTSTDGSIEGLTTLEEESRSELLPVEEGLALIVRRDITQGLIERAEHALLVVAQAQLIFGSVLGGDGEAISGAKVVLGLPEDFANRFDQVLARATTKAWEVSSAANGTFELVDAPSLAGCSLTVTAEGYRTAVLMDVPLAEEQLSSGALVITLERQDPQRIVRGVVLDPSGDPVAKARVGLGLPVRVTDATGEFEFELDGDDGASEGPQRLLASAKGWCPVEFKPEAAGNGSIDWPDFVELRLERTSLSIEGVVLDRNGDPKSGVAVWVDDLTVLGENESGFLETVENSGRSVSMLHLRYKTDEAGRFRIDDLAPRDYTLVAMDLVTLSKSQPEAITAGASSAVLRFDPAIEQADLVGRVVDRAGAPIEGVSLEWTRFAQWVSQPGRTASRVNILRTDPVLTGPDGKFKFKDVPLDKALKLHLSREGYQPLDVDLANLGSPHEDFSIVLGARCDVKVFGEANVRSIKLLDAAGNTLPLWSFPEPNTTSRSDAIGLKKGVTVPFQVSDAAVEIVFSAGSDATSSKAIRLEPGKLNEIHQ